MWDWNISPEPWNWSVQNQLCSSHNTHDNENDLSQVSTGKFGSTSKLVILFPLCVCFFFCFYFCSVVVSFSKKEEKKKWRLEVDAHVMFPWQTHAKEVKSLMKDSTNLLFCWNYFVNNFSTLNKVPFLPVWFYFLIFVIMLFISRGSCSFWMQQVKHNCMNVALELLELQPLCTVLPLLSNNVSGQNK